MTLRAGFALAGSIAVLVGGCFEPLDTTREDQPGTFGHLVLDVACQRIAYLNDLADGGKVDVRNDKYRDMCKAYDPVPAAPADAPVDLKALQAVRPQLVDSLDAIFPEDFLGDLQGFLASNEFLSAYDDQTAIQAVEALIGTLRLFAEDEASMQALERLNVRIGYRPLKPALGVVRSVVNYPELHDALLALTEAITPGGSARGEWDNLVAAVGATLRDAEVTDDPGASDRVGRLALDLLLSEHDLLGTDRIIDLVRRDQRGLALPVRIDVAGSPFVDDDDDGLADVDARGQLVCKDCVDANDQPIEAPSPFAVPSGDERGVWQFRDAEGRPTNVAQGQLLYQYVDLDKTMLLALARDGIQLFDPQKGTALDLLRGSSALMGPRAELEKHFDNDEALTYRGYEVTCVADATAEKTERGSCNDGERAVPSKSALLDMLYGYLQVLRDPAIFDTLALGKALLTSREAQVARLVEQAIVAARKADLHPEAGLPADSPLWDDLMPIIRTIASNPALVADLLRALESSQVKGLSEHFRNYMLNKDTFAFDTSLKYAGATRALDYFVPNTFRTAVDRAQPDTGNNRSIMQRLFHLIAESNGARMCNKQDAQPAFGTALSSYDECRLVEVPNLAVLYVQSIAYAKDASGRIVCETNKGAFGSTSTAATPQQCPSGQRPRPKANLDYQWGNARGVNPEAIINIAGGDNFIENQAGLTGFRTHPTPFALNRMLALDDGADDGAPDCPIEMPDFLKNVVDAVKDKDGDKFCYSHPDILQVWELNGFYDEIRPIIQAFADHDAEQQFVDILTVLHKHWASDRSINHQTTDPARKDYVFGSAANTYEPLIADILAGGTLLDALVDGSPAINATTANGKTAPTILAAAARFLVTPQAALADRLGRKTSTTSDGRAVAQLSPWQILADAYVLKRERLAAAGAEGQAWADSIREVIDVLARAVDVPSVGWRFKNPRMRGVAIALIDFVDARLRAHASDREAWLSKELPNDLTNALLNPVFAGAADFVLSLEATPETRRHLEGLVQYLVDEVNYDESFVAAVTSMADLMQLALSDADIVPLAHVAGEALRPERGWVEKQLTFFKRARQADQNQALVRIVRNLYSEYEPGRTAIGELVDGISEILRARPYEGDELDKPFVAEDFRALMLGIASFLDDEKRGLRKFISIIENRNIKTASTSP